MYRESWSNQHGSLINVPTKTTEGDEFTTDPLCIGNLFASPWRRTCTSHPQKEETQNSVLNTNLLQYYLSNGFGKKNANILKKVMLQTVSRGDISGMHFMVSHGYCSLDDSNLCTMAGAAGQLLALKWLRGDFAREGYDLKDSEKQLVVCPWNPTEVHREAAENSHDHILEYVERNSEGYHIHTHYGAGLPW
jgi:hypothetical protein